MRSEIKYHPLLRTVAAAEKALSERKNQKAVDLFTRVIEDPQISQLEKGALAACLLNRGMALRRTGCPYDALEDYARVIELNPKSFKPHLNSALIYAQDLELYDEAVDEFDKAIELNPTCTDAWSSRGLTKLLMDDSQGAETDLQTAIRLEPRHSDALCNLGNLYFKQGQYKQAADIYQRALEIIPGDVEVRTNLALALKRLGADRAADSVLRQDKKALKQWKQKVDGAPGRFDLSLAFIEIFSPLYAVVIGTTAMFMYGFTGNILIGAIFGGVVGAILGFILAASAKSRPVEHWYTTINAPDLFPVSSSHPETRVEVETGALGSILGLIFGLAGAWILSVVVPARYPLFWFAAFFGFGASGWGVSKVFGKLSR